MIKNCLTCGKAFEIKPCRNGVAKYCSIVCYPKDGKNNNFWGKKHTSKTKERMREVWAIRKSKGYVPHNKQFLFKKCLICGINFKVTKYTLNRYVCCSKKCHNTYCSLYLRGERGRNWIDGRSFFPYPPQFNKPLKLKIRKRDSFKCLHCGCEEDLSIHHIDYNKNNNFEDNLITLCLKCNSLANGNRKYWIKFYQERINRV